MSYKKLLQPLGSSTLLLFLLVDCITSVVISAPQKPENRLVSNMPIVFVSRRDGNLEIYAMSVDGSNVTRLTNNAKDDWGPDLSPDNKRFVFMSERDGNTEIYLMNTDGSSQTRLTNNKASDFSPRWSPDGSRIAFVSERDGNLEIYVMNADGSGQIRLTKTPSLKESDPVWSPDGRQIAFEVDDQIYVMNADGTRTHSLTSVGINNFDPDWSPKEARIIFTSRREGDNEIYVMNADGTGQTNLTKNVSEDYAAAWSRDGRFIVFTSDRDGNEEIYIMNADGTGQTRLTTNSYSDFTPDCGQINTPVRLSSEIPTTSKKVSSTTTSKPTVLPSGLQKVVIGKAFNNEKDCQITEPLSTPIKFPAGTTQFAFQVVIDPEKAGSLRISLDGAGMSEGTKSVNCNKYAIVMGSPQQYQWGATISSIGGKALKSGTYVLKVIVDGKTVEVPFEIEK